MSVKGVVQKFKDAGPQKGKFGIQHRISLQVEGEWYSGFFGKSAESLKLRDGCVVSFTYTEKGDFKNIDVKSLQVSEPAEQPAKVDAPAATSKPAYRSGDAGIKVGHAINNAVQLGVAAGKTDIKSLHGFAVDILTLSRKLEGQYEQIVAVADKKIAAGTVGAAPAEKSAATPEKAAETPKPKAKPGPKPKPKPAPEPEPEYEEQEETAEPDAEPDFDDDIPF